LDRERIATEADWATALAGASLDPILRTSVAAPTHLSAFQAAPPILVGMKLKQRPDDFQVEEISTFNPGTSGPYAYYRLEKRSIGTAEAIQKVCKQLRIDPQRIRYGGLKDRHAVTVQYLTIDEGPHRHLRDPQVHLRYLGQVEEPYSPQSFTGNRFTITLRDLDQPELERVEQALSEVKQSLIGNYFDDQRFGSVSPPPTF
jgi:tRNA pseudouridine13 synthase